MKAMTLGRASAAAARALSAATETGGMARPLAEAGNQPEGTDGLENSHQSFSANAVDNEIHALAAGSASEPP